MVNTQALRDEYRNKSSDIAIAGIVAALPSCFSGFFPAIAKLADRQSPNAEYKSLDFRGGSSIIHLLTYRRKNQGHSVSYLLSQSTECVTTLSYLDTNRHDLLPTAIRWRRRPFRLRRSSLHRLPVWADYRLLRVIMSHPRLLFVVPFVSQGDLIFPPLAIVHWLVLMSRLFR